MIQVLKINGEPFWINCEQIRSVESTPDTRIIFCDGESVLVRNTPEEINIKILKYKQQSHPEYTSLKEQNG